MTAEKPQKSAEKDKENPFERIFGKEKAIELLLPINTHYLFANAFDKVFANPAILLTLSWL